MLQVKEIRSYHGVRKRENLMMTIVMTKAKVTVIGAKIKGIKTKVKVVKAVMRVKKVKIAVRAARKARKVKAAVLAEIEVMREVIVEETAVITAERETTEGEEVEVLKATVVATVAVERDDNGDGHG